MRTKEQLIKELSIKEILDELCSANNRYVVGIEASPEYREVFSRLEQGRMAIEIVDELHASFTIETPQHLCDMVIEFVKKREGIGGAE